MIDITSQSQASIEKAQAIAAKAAEAAKKVQDAIDKAREAQKKLIELKKKAAKIRAKKELYKKKAQETRQTLRKLKESKPALKGIGGGIAAIVASQVGMIRAMIVVQVKKKIIELYKKFATGCPDSRELAKVIKIKNTLLKQISSINKRVQVLSKIAKTILAIVVTLKIIIKIITSIPIPTAIIPPMTGGIGVPMSILTKFSNALVKLNKILDKLIDEAGAIIAIVASIGPPLQALEEKLQSLEMNIVDCTLEAAKQEEEDANLQEDTGVGANTGTGVGEDTGTGDDIAGNDEIGNTQGQQTEAAINLSIDKFFDENADSHIGTDNATSIDDLIDKLVPQIVDQMSDKALQGDQGPAQVRQPSSGATSLKPGLGEKVVYEVVDGKVERVLVRSNAGGYREFSQAKEFVLTLDLQNSNQWSEYTKSGKLPADIPASPMSVYTEDWLNMDDWLGIDQSGTRTGIGTGTGTDGGAGGSIGEGGLSDQPTEYYKGYTLRIVRDPESPKLAPKNYATAADKLGVIILRGPSSFSSSTQILLDELKFRIDQLL